MICRDPATLAVLAILALVSFSEYEQQKRPENNLSACPPTMMVAERDLSGATAFVAMENIYTTENGSQCRI